MATCSAELVWQTVAFLHQIEAALVGRAWQSLQNTPETRQEGFIRRADYRCGYLSFNFEEKKMKNVLLATTAIALTAGYAAADVSYSASAKLSYGNFGEGDFSNGGTAAAASTYGYSNEFDFVVSGSGEAGGVSYSASMTIDETTPAAGGNALGAVSLSTMGFTYSYDANDMGGLVDSGADGEDDDAGDWMLSYAANGLSASYEVDEEQPGRYDLILGYAANGMSVGLHASDDDGDNTVDLAADAAVVAAGGVTSAALTADDAVINTVSVGYTIGDLALSYAADDRATQNYDASAAYTIGGTVLTAATDENEQHSLKIATSFGGVSLTARTETDKKSSAGGDGAENELALSYTTGALTVSYSKDTGNVNQFGDEAETVTSITYTVGGMTLQAKGTDRDETEVSAAFSF
jgi:outer membrane protein OmpU